MERGTWDPFSVYDFLHRYLEMSILILFLQIPVPEGVQPRCCHSLTSISTGRHLIEVLMFGGCAQYDPVKPAEALVKLAGTTVITFSEWAPDQYYLQTVQD